MYFTFLPFFTNLCLHFKEYEVERSCLIQILQLNKLDVICTFL